MIRMLALDLDETTLRSDGTISLYTMQTLQRAAAQGVILVAASGRPLRSLPEHLQACGVRYAVVSNGAAVYELEGEQLLRQLFLPADAVTALFQLVQEEQDRQVLVEAGLHGQMYAPADYVADPISFRYNAAVAAYVRRTRKPVEDMARFLQMHVQEIDCMDIICPNGTRKAQMAQKVSNAGLPVYMTSSVPQLVEIAHADAGKANGIRFLAKRCGISLEQVMACGNADNDAEMLRDAGMGVAVANAMESCLAAADDITDSNDEDGVAKAVERFLLSEEKYF